MPLQSTDCSRIHKPVMVRELIALLCPQPDGVYVDATVGLGGHSLEILRRLGVSGRLIGIDRDERALEVAKELLFDSRVTLLKAKFSELETVLKELKVERVRGVLFDLGVSMMQLKDYSRGFSFFSDSRLDMRMDTDSSLSAWDVVNTYDEERLYRIFKEYGEEVFARKVAKEIVRARQRRKIETCKELSEIICQVVPRQGRIHPATKVFQAIRIEVNRELEELKEGLRQAVKVLDRGGRLCVLSYHSVEDRIVKSFLKEEEAKGTLRILTKKPLFPSIEEIRENPSSRSARLRGGEKHEIFSN